MDSSSPFLNITKDIKKITDELYKTTKITYFHYERAYPDHSHITLINHEDWLKHCLDQEYYRISFFESNLSADKSQNYLWSNLNEISQPIFTTARNDFDIHNGYSMVKKNDQFTEYFHFATDEYHKTSNYYQEYSRELESFTHYFRYRANKIIKHIEPYRFHYPEGNYYDLNTGTLKQSPSSIVSNDLRRFYLFDDSEVYFTKAELIFAIKLLQLGTIQLTARELGITPRTAYGHFDSIKQKLKVRTAFQVGATLAKSSLFLRLYEEETETISA